MNINVYEFLLTLPLYLPSEHFGFLQKDVMRIDWCFVFVNSKQVKAMYIDSQKHATQTYQPTIASYSQQVKRQSR